MFCVHAHDPGVVHHLRQNHHVGVCLHDAFNVVVERRQHRRAGYRAETEQTALRERAHLRMVVGTGAAFLEPPGGPRIFLEAPPTLRCARFAELRHLGQAAILRDCNDGGAEFAVDGKRLIAVVDPERVVPANVAGSARRTITAFRRCFAVGI